MEKMEKTWETVQILFRYMTQTYLMYPPPPPKTKMTTENPPWMKMYVLLNMGIFQCHVSFQGCILYIIYMIYDICI